MSYKTTKQTGDEGEDIATRFLINTGCTIVERNARFDRDEIDIIAFDRELKMMVFAEVKTRTKNDEKYPIRLAVDQRKRVCLQRAIAKWCLKNSYEGPGRIDVICVSGERVIDHIQELQAVFF